MRASAILDRGISRPSGRVEDVEYRNAWLSIDAFEPIDSRANARRPPGLDGVRRITEWRLKRLALALKRTRDLVAHLWTSFRLMPLQRPAVGIRIISSVPAKIVRLWDENPTSYRVITIFRGLLTADTLAMVGYFRVN